MEEGGKIKFYIPEYQRGYRWTQSQVLDLLEDIRTFSQGSTGGFYCLQPLVVKYDEEERRFEVIDGQQRLTTLRLILGCLTPLESLGSKEPYALSYATRENSCEFIEKTVSIPYGKIKEERPTIEIGGKTYGPEHNIDYYHIWDAYKTISTYLQPSEDAQVVIKEAEGGKEGIKVSGITDEAGLSKFAEALLERTQFIWYRPGSEDGCPAEIFRRLNIGKIPLRDSELIKALLLDRNHGQVCKPRELRIRQQEIALQWDMIENALGDDEFWHFLHYTPRRKYKPSVPTRIDFIFELIYQLNKELYRNASQDGENSLVNQRKQNNDVTAFGSTGESDSYASYKTFHYFNRYLKKSDSLERIECIWNAVMEVFTVLRTWFEDVKLYHYVGFLLCREGRKEENIEDLSNGKAVVQLLNDWYAMTYRKFRDELKEKIWARICDATCSEEVAKERTYAKVAEALCCVEYDSDETKAKRLCRPILLLHNIQTCIIQNRNEDSRFSMRAHTKFPFHLYKIEGWDVEHINSASYNPGMDDKSRMLWVYGACMMLASRLLSAKPESMPDVGLSLVESLKAFMDQLKESSPQSADDVYAKLRDELGYFLGWGELDGVHDKNRIWNFALLDSSTNRSYGNAIFPVKRQILLEKDRGRRYRNLDKEKLIDLLDVLLKVLNHGDGKEKLEPATLMEHVYEGTQAEPPFFAFIPVCTKYAFMKYYSPTNNEPNVWTEADAKHYLSDILAKLADFYEKGCKYD